MGWLYPIFGGTASSWKMGSGYPNFPNSFIPLTQATIRMPSLLEFRGYSIYQLVLILMLDIACQQQLKKSNVKKGKSSCWCCLIQSLDTEKCWKDLENLNCCHSCQRKLRCRRCPEKQQWLDQILGIERWVEGNYGHEDHCLSYHSRNEEKAGGCPGQPQ